MKVVRLRRSFFLEGLSLLSSEARNMSLILTPKLEKLSLRKSVEFVLKIEFDML